MLTDFPSSGVAFTTRQVWDITEPDPIPKGATVSVEDWLPDDGCDGIFVVEWNDRIYLATPDELR